MIRKLALPLLIALTVCVCACAQKSETAEEGAAPASSEDAFKPQSMEYINTLLDTALKLKFYINDYESKNNNLPETLKDLNYPAMTFVTHKITSPDGTERELISGSFDQENIYVRYEPTSFGKQGNPMLALTYGKDFSKDTASIQWANGVISCVAYGTSGFANATCKTFKKNPDNKNPLRNYYNLDNVITPEHKKALLSEVEEMISSAEFAAKLKKNRKK